MSLPDYWLPQPSYCLSTSEQQACDALMAQALAADPHHFIDYTLTIPKWQFLCHVTAAHNVALHGSGKPDIAQFIPNQPRDLREFSAQNAVYAADDGIWSLYFAILDRTIVRSLINGCIYIETAAGTRGEPHYLFSINRTAVAQQPYINGTIYLLPKHTFIREPVMEVDGLRIHSAQLASLEPVTPLTKLAVTPEDFPFLPQMRTHDDERMAEYGEATNKGMPWPD